MRIVPLLPWLLPCLASAQTYYYINSISVDPPAPTTSDPVTITVHGDLSSSGAFIVSATAAVIGDTVELDIVAADPGGLAVLVPHDEVFPLGTLPAGDYTIVVNGTFVWDMAPAPQHLFTVAGGATACDSLLIEAVYWAPFSDTALVVHVMNFGTGQYNYPNFILYDQNGDTLAKETVTFFAIIAGGESWHTLTIQPGVTIPDGPFTGSLELWVLFGDSVACSFNHTGEFCPPDPCVELNPVMVNTGGAIVTANIAWELLDADSIAVGSGTFDLTTTEQQDFDTLCVPPGAYTLWVNHPVPVGGQLQISLEAGGNSWAAVPAVLFTQDGVPDPVPFDFYPGCFDNTNGIAPPMDPSGVMLAIMNDQLHVRSNDASAIGDLVLFDARGRVLARRQAAPAEATLDLSTMAEGVYLLRLVDRSVSWRFVWQ